jgi:hypothetical protein
MLNLPIKMNAIIRARCPEPQQLKIIGFPEFSFRRDDEMLEFTDYLQTYMDFNAAMREEFERRVDVYNSAKEA